MNRLNELKPIDQYTHIWRNEQAFKRAPQVRAPWYNSHIVRDLKVKVYENELYIPSVAPNDCDLVPPKRKKGDINAFSTKSRMRILHKFNRLQTKHLSEAIFCTFTAPHDLCEPEVFQERFLKKLLPALQEIIPNLVYAWRLEPHRDGYPHYHLFCWSWDQERNLSSRYYKDQIRDAWSQAFDCYDRAFRNHALDVKPVRNRRKAMSYITKYMAKEDSPEGQQIRGRRWGNSKNLPAIPITEIELSDSQRSQLIKASKALLRAKGYIPDYVIDDISVMSDSFLWIELNEIVELLKTIPDLEIPPELEAY